MASKTKVGTPTPNPDRCPSCGRCNTCGHKDEVQVAPYVQPYIQPYVQPWYPSQPQIWYTTSTAANTFPAFSTT